MSGAMNVLPECVWSEHPITLWEFVKGKNAEILPAVVKVNQIERIEENELIDWDQPFMIYSHRRRTKICAKNLAWNQNKKKFTSQGPMLEIAKDYPGWFQIVDNDSNKEIGHGYSNLHKLVKSNLSQILLVRSPVSGFKEDKTTNKLNAHSINPGEILKIDEIWNKEWDVNNNTDNYKTTDLLKAFDLNHNVVHIPLEHPASAFSPVGGNKDPTNLKLVYQIKNVIEFWKPGTKIKLIFGWAPQGIDNFDGYLQIDSFTRPECAIAYNFRCEKHVLFEMPLDALLTVEIAENRQDFIHCDAYQDVLEVCQKVIYPYVVNIKPLNIPYHPLHIEECKNKSGEDGLKIKSSKHSSKKLMAPPRDMKKFNPSDVYPPMKCQYVSNTWKIVYSSPENVYQDFKSTLDIEDQGESYTDPQPVFSNDLEMVEHVFTQMTLQERITDGKCSRASSKSSTLSGRRSVRDLFENNEASDIDT